MIPEPTPLNPICYNDPMSTLTLALQIAPQRSTQYAQLANELAPQEVRLSPLGEHLEDLRMLSLGGQHYLQVRLNAPLDDDLRYELATFATLSGAFILHEGLNGHPGPLLEPLEPIFQPVIAPELAHTRRYRGKTNELFTHFMCNVARYSSDSAHRRWDGLRLLDPLAGGGTTLFTALSLGADVVGVEQTAQDVTTTVAFLRDYVREQGIACQIKEERLRKAGQRWWCRLTLDGMRQFVFARGETTRTDHLISGFKKPHFIVADLPYGIQHRGELEDLLRSALPVWARVLNAGGALVFAWDATSFPRDEMVALVDSACALSVLQAAPYDQLAHRVDRVIKRRDLIVAR